MSHTPPLEQVNVEVPYSQHLSDLAQNVGDPQQSRNSLLIKKSSISLKCNNNVDIIGPGGERQKGLTRTGSFP